MDDFLCCYCAGGRLTPPERSRLVVLLDEMIRNREKRLPITMSTLSGEIWTELKTGLYGDFEGMEFYGHLKNSTGWFTIVMLFNRERYLGCSEIDGSHFRLDRVRKKVLVLQ